MNFDEIVNDFCREFRKRRDELLKMSQADLKREIDKFWGRMPWYIAMFRGPIMRAVYKQIKDEL